MLYGKIHTIQCPGIGQFLSRVHKYIRLHKNRLFVSPPPEEIQFIWRISMSRVISWLLPSPPVIPFNGKEESAKRKRRRTLYSNMPPIKLIWRCTATYLGQENGRIDIQRVKIPRILCGYQMWNEVMCDLEPYLGRVFICLLAYWH